MPEQIPNIYDGELIEPVTRPPQYPVGLLFMQLETVRMVGPTTDTSLPEISEE